MAEYLDKNLEDKIILLVKSLIEPHSPKGQVQIQLYNKCLRYAISKAKEKTLDLVPNTKNIGYKIEKLVERVHSLHIANINELLYKFIADKCQDPVSWASLDFIITLENLSECQESTKGNLYEQMPVSMGNYLQQKTPLSDSKCKSAFKTSRDDSVTEQSRSVRFVDERNSALEDAKAITNTSMTEEPCDQAGCSLPTHSLSKAVQVVTYQDPYLLHYQKLHSALEPPKDVRYYKMFNEKQLPPQQNKWWLIDKTGKNFIPNDSKNAAFGQLFHQFMAKINDNPDTTRAKNEYAVRNSYLDVADEFFLLREILYMYLVTNSCKFFAHENGLIYVRPNVSIPSVTTIGNQSFLMEHCIPEVRMMDELRKFLKKKDINSMDNEKRNIECFSKYMNYLNKYYWQIVGIIAEIDSRLCQSKESFTLISLTRELRDVNEMIRIVYKINKNFDHLEIEKWPDNLCLVYMMIVFENVSPKVFYNNEMDIFIDFHLMILKSFTGLIEGWRDGNQNFLKRQHLSEEDFLYIPEKILKMMSESRFKKIIVNYWKDTNLPLWVLVKMKKIDDLLMRNKKILSKTIYEEIIEKLLTFTKEKGKQHRKQESINTEEEKGNDFLRSTEVLCAKDALLRLSIMKKSSEPSFGIENLNVMEILKSVLNTLPYQDIIWETLCKTLILRSHAINIFTLNVLLKENNLLDHLENMNELFLARDHSFKEDFYGKFFEIMETEKIFYCIDELQDLFNEYLINERIKSSIKIKIKIDKSYKKMRERQKKKNLRVLDNIDRVYLNYKMPIAYKFLIETKDLIKLNHIFHFIMKIKKSEHILKELECTSIQLKDDCQMALLYQLLKKQRISFLNYLYKIIYYFNDGRIERSFEKMSQTMLKCRNMNHLKIVYQKHLKRLLQIYFLNDNDKDLYQVFIEFLNLIQRLSDLWHKFILIMDINLKQMDKISNFEKYIGNIKNLDASSWLASINQNFSRRKTTNNNDDDEEDDSKYSIDEAVNIIDIMEKVLITKKSHLEEIDFDYEPFEKINNEKDVNRFKNIDINCNYKIKSILDKIQNNIQSNDLLNVSELQMPLSNFLQMAQIFRDTKNSKNIDEHKIDLLESCLELESIIRNMRSMKLNHNVQNASPRSTNFNDSYQFYDNSSFSFNNSTKNNIDDIDNINDLADIINNCESPTRLHLISDIADLKKALPAKSHERNDLGFSHQDKSFKENLLKIKPGSILDKYYEKCKSSAKLNTPETFSSKNSFGCSSLKSHEITNKASESSLSFTLKNQDEFVTLDNRDDLKKFISNKMKVFDVASCPEQSQEIVKPDKEISMIGKGTSTTLKDDMRLMDITSNKKFEKSPDIFVKNKQKSSQLCALKAMEEINVNQNSLDIQMRSIDKSSPISTSNSNEKILLADQIVGRNPKKYYDILVGKSQELPLHDVSEEESPKTKDECSPAIGRPQLDSFDKSHDILIEERQIENLFKQSQDISPTFNFSNKPNTISQKISFSREASKIPVLTSVANPNLPSHILDAFISKSGATDNTPNPDCEGCNMNKASYVASLGEKITDDEAFKTLALPQKALEKENPDLLNESCDPGASKGAAYHPKALEDQTDSFRGLETVLDKKIGRNVLAKEQALISEPDIKETILSTSTSSAMGQVPIKETTDMEKVSYSECSSSMDLSGSSESLINECLSLSVVKTNDQMRHRPIISLFETQSGTNLKRKRTIYINNAFSSISYLNFERNLELQEVKSLQKVTSTLPVYESFETLQKKSRPFIISLGRSQSNVATTNSSKDNLNDSGGSSFSWSIPSAHSLGSGTTNSRMNKHLEKISSGITDFPQNLWVYSKIPVFISLYSKNLLGLPKYYNPSMSTEAMNTTKKVQWSEPLKEELNRVHFPMSKCINNKSCLRRNPVDGNKHEPEGTKSNSTTSSNNQNDQHSTSEKSEKSRFSFFERKSLSFGTATIRQNFPNLWQPLISPTLKSCVVNKSEESPSVDSIKNPLKDDIQPDRSLKTDSKAVDPHGREAIVGVSDLYSTKSNRSQDSIQEASLQTLAQATSPYNLHQTYSESNLSSISAPSMSNFTTSSSWSCNLDSCSISKAVISNGGPSEGSINVHSELNQKQSLLESNSSEITLSGRNQQGRALFSREAIISKASPSYNLSLASSLQPAAKSILSNIETSNHLVAPSLGKRTKSSFSLGKQKSNDLETPEESLWESNSSEITSSMRNQEGRTPSSAGCIQSQWENAPSLGKRTKSSFSLGKQKSNDLETDVRASGTTPTPLTSNIEFKKAVMETIIDIRKANRDKVSEKLGTFQNASTASSKSEPCSRKGRPTNWKQFFLEFPYTETNENPKRSPDLNNDVSEHSKVFPATDSTSKNPRINPIDIGQVSDKNLPSKSPGETRNSVATEAFIDIYTMSDILLNFFSINTEESKSKQNKTMTTYPVQSCSRSQKALIDLLSDFEDANRSLVIAFNIDSFGLDKDISELLLDFDQWYCKLIQMLEKKSIERPSKGIQFLKESFKTDAPQ